MGALGHAPLPTVHHDQPFSFHYTLRSLARPLSPIPILGKGKGEVGLHQVRLPRQRQARSTHSIRTERTAISGTGVIPACPHRQDNTTGRWWLVQHPTVQIQLDKTGTWPHPLRDGAHDLGLDFQNRPSRRGPWPRSPRLRPPALRAKVTNNPAAATYSRTVTMTPPGE
jgi:hypothetical protein